jgi:preprotein translocase subunit YajC
MTRHAILASALLLGLLVAAPSWAAVVEGTVESVSGDTATIRSDDGGTFTVDLAGIGAAGRGSAVAGQHVTVEGNYTRDVTFAASSVSSGTQRPSGSPTIHGTVQSVSGKTLMVQSYDGGVFTVDASQVASLPSLRPGDAVTVTGNYPGGVTIAASDIRPSPRPQEVAQPGRQEWQRVHGRVEKVQDRTLTFKADDGRTLSVDMSRVSQSVQRALSPGEGATLIGFAGSSADRFTARYIQQDSSARSRAGRGGSQPAASPATTR